jgi:membrane protease YdiL (CAAX protease family)
MTRDDDGLEPELDERVRPLSALGAAGWTFVATLAFFFAWSTAVSVREAAKDDLLTGAGSQLVGYGFALFLVLRVHAPATSMRRVLGLRPTHPLFYLAGLLLGLGLYLPIDAFYELVEQRWPSSVPETLPALWEAASTPRRIVIGLSIALFGPFVEEVFFRGVLLRPLTHHAERQPLLAPSLSGWRRAANVLSGGSDDEPGDPPSAPPRKAARLEAVVVTAALFALVHIEWQKLAPLFLMGLVLGFLRARSGSLLPSVLLHCAFNGVALAQLATGADLHPPAWSLFALGLGSLAIVAVAHTVTARSEQATLARNDEP